MTLLERLLAALGLPAATGEDEAIASVTALHASQAQASTSLQAALDPIAVKVGLQAGADAGAVLAGVERLAAQGGDAATITALQSELATVTTTLNSVVEATKRKDAEAFVDGAIKDMRVGIKPQRDRYVSMHMADPTGTEALINALPKFGAVPLVPSDPPAREGEISLHAEHIAVARQLGIDPKDYAETLRLERAAGQETF